MEFHLSPKRVHQIFCMSYILKNFLSSNGVQRGYFPPLSNGDHFNIHVFVHIYPQAIMWYIKSKSIGYVNGNALNTLWVDLIKFLNKCFLKKYLYNKNIGFVSQHKKKIIAYFITISVFLTYKFKQTSPILFQWSQAKHDHIKHNTQDPRAKHNHSCLAL